MKCDVFHARERHPMAKAEFQARRIMGSAEALKTP
jgi:hypothetical protein